MADATGKRVMRSEMADAIIGNIELLDTDLPRSFGEEFGRGEFHRGKFVWFPHDLWRKVDRGWQQFYDRQPSMSRADFFRAIVGAVCDSEIMKYPPWRKPEELTEEICRRLRGPDESGRIPI